MVTWDRECPTARGGKEVAAIWKDGHIQRPYNKEDGQSLIELDTKRGFCFHLKIVCQFCDPGSGVKHQRELYLRSDTVSSVTNALEQFDKGRREGAFSPV